MKKPIPSEFNLDEQSIQKIEEIIPTIETILYLVCFAIPFILMTYTLWKKLKWESVIISFLGSLFGSYAVSKTINYLITQLFFSNYAKFKNAKQKYDNWYIRTQTEFWNRMNGRTFEREVALLLEKSGHKARVTPVTGDHGIDIILEDGTIIQCKAHKKPISPGAARDLYGTLKHFKASNAILISRSGFTKGVYEFTKGKPIKLWDLNNLIKLQKKLDE